MNTAELRSPERLSEASWSTEVLDVLDWVNKLRFEELCLASAWCSSRVGLGILSGARAVQRGLEPLWAEREHTSRKRVTVLGRWKHGWAARLDMQPCSADGLDLATRAMISSLFAPEGFPLSELEELQRPFKEVREVVTLVSTLSSAEQELALVLAPEWFGTPAELVEASRNIG